jgi:hypothetical protein
VTNNAGAGPRLAVKTAGTHGRHTIDEFRFADGAHFDGSGGAQHRARLHKHRGYDVMASVGVGQQFIEQIAPSGPVPEMVVRVNDRQIGLKGGFLAPV